VQIRRASLALAVTLLATLGCSGSSPSDPNNPVEVLEGQIVHGETTVAALPIGDGDVIRIDLKELEVVQGTIEGFVLRIGVGLGRAIETGCGNTASRSMGIGDEWVARLPARNHCLNLAMPGAYADDVVIRYTIELFKS
jgi:hypothetical protein